MAGFLHTFTHKQALFFMGTLKGYFKMENVNKFFLDYSRMVNSLKSTHTHPELVDYNALIRLLRLIQHSLTTLDHFKKSLFYGKAFPRDCMETLNKHFLTSSDEQTIIPELTPITNLSPANRDVVHSIIGLATEVGELFDHLLNIVDLGDTKLDDAAIANVYEEIGDVMWYNVLLADTVSNITGHGGKNEPIVDALLANGNKLRTRYGKEFTSIRANERDLAAEQTAFEEMGIDPQKRDPSSYLAIPGIQYPKLVAALLERLEDTAFNGIAYCTKGSDWACIELETNWSFSKKELDALELMMDLGDLSHVDALINSVFSKID